MSGQQIVDQLIAGLEARQRRGWAPRRPREVRDQVVGHATQVGSAPNLAELVGRVRRALQPNDRVALATTSPLDLRGLQRPRHVIVVIFDRLRKWRLGLGHGAKAGVMARSATVTRIVVEAYTCSKEGGKGLLRASAP